MKSQLLFALGTSLTLTLIIEIAFFWLIDKNDKNDLLLVCLVNILTNPPVVLLYWLAILYLNLNNTLVIVILEFCAIIVEAYYYKNYGQNFKHPFVFSLTANIISFGIGLLI